MAKKLIDVQANGFKSYVDATATAVGAEPALGDPGPGAWYLRAIDNVRSWVASIPWAGVDKTGAVATDVGALPSLTLGGDVDANSINSGASCVVKFQGVTSWTNFPFANSLLMSGKGGVFTQLSGKDSGISQCWTDLTDGGTYRRNYVTAYGWSPWYTDWDSYNLPAGTTGKALLATASQAAARSAISALPTANPTATGTLTAPDVVVSNLAGTGTRTAAVDSMGKVIVDPNQPEYAILRSANPLNALGGAPRSVFSIALPAEILLTRSIRVSFQYDISNGSGAYISTTLGGLVRTDSSLGAGGAYSTSGTVSMIFTKASSTTVGQIARNLMRRTDTGALSITDQNYDGSEFSALDLSTALTLSVNLSESSGTANLYGKQLLVEVV